MATPVRPNAAFFPSIQKKPLHSIGGPAGDGIAGQPGAFVGDRLLAPLKPLGPVIVPGKSDEGFVLILGLHPHPMRLDVTGAVHGKRCALCTEAGKEFWRCGACDYNLCPSCKGKQPNVIGANFHRPMAVGKVAPRPLQSLPSYPVLSVSQPPTPPPQLLVDESDPIPVPTDEVIDAPQHWHPLRFTMGLNGHRCDVCHALGTMFLHCAECQYDLCRICHMRELKKGEPTLLEQVLAAANGSSPPRRASPRTLQRSQSMPAQQRHSSPPAASAAPAVNPAAAVAAPVAAAKPLPQAPTPHPDAVLHQQQHHHHHQPQPQQPAFMSVTYVDSSVVKVDVAASGQDLAPMPNAGEPVAAEPSLPQLQQRPASVKPASFVSETKAERPDGWGGASGGIAIASVG